MATPFSSVGIPMFGTPIGPSSVRCWRRESAGRGRRAPSDNVTSDLQLNDAEVARPTSCWPAQFGRIGRRSKPGRRTSRVAMDRHETRHPRATTQSTGSIGIKGVFDGLSVRVDEPHRDVSRWFEVKQISSALISR